MVVIEKINYETYENEHIKVLGPADQETSEKINANRKNKAKVWNCLCKHCGTAFSTAQNNITKIKSCGCSRRFRNAEAEIGNKYGRLTIIDIDWEKTMEMYNAGYRYGVFYKCRCECGTEKTYRLNTIKYGHTQSCGCLKFNNPNIMEDLTGQTFGRLTVTKRDVERDRREIDEGRHCGNVHWLCQCSCGNPELKSVTGWQLKSGHTKSCGCYNSETTALRNKLYSSKINHHGRIKDNLSIKNEDEMVIYDEKEENYFVISKEDYDSIKDYYWRKITEKEEPNPRKRYWVTNNKMENIKNGEQYTLRIHQIIAQNKYGEYDKNRYMPDHLSRDPNDNTRKNIYLKTNMDNSHNRGLSRANTSGKTGVYFDRDSSKWLAAITVNYETIQLGRFLDFDEAVAARVAAEEKYGFTCDNNYPEYDRQAI